MGFFAKYMLENDGSNLQVWSAYHSQYFQNNPILKSQDYTPTSQLWKLTLPLGEVVGLKSFR